MNHTHPKIQTQQNAPPEKQTNKQMWAPGGEWWMILTGSYIIVVRLPNINSTDVGIGTKFCLLRGWAKYFFFFFCEFKICKAWIVCYRMTDLNISFTSAGEQRHVRQNSLELIWAVLQETVVLHLCRLSPEAEEMREGSLNAAAASFVTVMQCSSDPSLLKKKKKENRIKSSLTTNVPYHGTMMKHLLWQRFF